jgi:hypothetical protein
MPSLKIFEIIPNFIKSIGNDLCPELSPTKDSKYYSMPISNVPTVSLICI